MRILASLALAGVVLVPAVRAASPAAWPQFRGPNGAGIADDATLPVSWSTTEHVAWTADLPGRGWSSPIVWGDRVFVTSAVNTNAFKAPGKGIFGNDYAAELEKQGLSEDEIVKKLVARDIELASESGTISYVVAALDAKTGKVVWQREAHRGPPPGGRHRKNTYASETPATDGERALRLVRRQRRRLLLHARRHAALVADVAAAADLPRLRDGLVAGRPRRARLPAPRQRRRVVLRRARREDRQGDLDGQAHRPRLPPRLRLGDAADLDERRSGPRSSPSAAASSSAMTSMARSCGGSRASASRRRARSSPAGCSTSDRDRRARPTGRCSRCGPARRATSRSRTARRRTRRRVVAAALHRLHAVAAGLPRPRSTR